MPRPVCVGCRIEMRCEKNSQGVELMAGIDPKTHGPYQIWDGDRYACPICGAGVVVGFGSAPIAEHPSSEDYASQRKWYGDDIIQVRERP